MPVFDPDAPVPTKAEVAAGKRKWLTTLKAEGLRPNTPQSVVDEMVKMVDLANLGETLAEVKARWPMYFGPRRTADQLAARTMT